MGVSIVTEEEPQEAMNAELYARVKALIVEQTGASSGKNQSRHAIGGRLGDSR